IMVIFLQELRLKRVKNDMIRKCFLMNVSVGVNLTKGLHGDDIGETIGGGSLR
ncbi:hypothetical protein HPP92_026923, partial [Vanilla planifolia]